MKKILFLFALCCLLLCGCSDKKVEEELLAIVLSVDQTDAGDMTVAVKVPVLSSASGENQGGGGDASGYMQLEATGHSFTDAVSMLNATTPRPLNFSQVREIVVGEAAARRPDLGRILSQIDALPRFRCSAAVIVCRGEARRFSEKQKPYLGMRLSRYAENTLANYAGKGFTPSTDLCAAVRDWGGGFRDPLLILGAVNDFSAPSTLDGENSLSAQAGDLPRKSAEPVEMFGAAATDGVSVSGYLTGYEMALLHLLSGHVEALTLETNGVPLHITAEAPASIGVELNARPVTLKIDARCVIHYPAGSPPDEKAVSARLENEIAAVIRHLQALRCDGVGFGAAAARRFLTVGQWEAFGWKQKYTEASLSVTVTSRSQEN